MATYQYDHDGLLLTEASEGLRLKAYLDSKGVPTIGAGHTGKDVYIGLVVTYAQADILLRADLASASATVNHALKINVTQHQFDALVDFTFNEGCGHFLTSTLLAKVNSRDIPGAAAEFMKWVTAGGQKLPGLVRRRTLEQAMFLEAA
jgi:lysozyme